MLIVDIPVNVVLWLGSGSKKGSRLSSKEGKRAESKSPARSPTKAESPSKKGSRGM